MGRPGSRELPLLIAALAAVLVVVTSWFLSGAPLGEEESPARFAVGGFATLLLPGLVLGEALRFRSRHVLEAIALAFALTVSIEAALLPLPFVLRTGISVWCAALLAVTAAGLGVLARRAWVGGEVVFLRPLIDLIVRARAQAETLAILAILAILTVVTYRWGDDLKGIAGEKILHAMFSRFYASLDMVVADLGAGPGMPPPNVVHFYEYLLAAWATLVRLDPLIVFYRARAMVPILGFAGVYLCASEVVRGRREVRFVLWAALLLSLADIIIVPPSSLASPDPLRGVMMFRGTNHHADVAMDILLASTCGLILRAFRTGSLRFLALLAGYLAVNFMWHPREFFQAALYAGLLGVSLALFAPLGLKTTGRRWGKVMGVFILVAAVMLAFSVLTVPRQAHAYPEGELKTTALRYALAPENLLGVRNLFNFPVHQMLVSTTTGSQIASFEQCTATFTKDWQLELWLLLSALSIPALAFRGNQRERLLGLFYGALWVLALGWNAGVLAVMALTYSEFYMSTTRLLYIFAYFLLPLLLLAVARRMRADETPNRLKVALGGVLGAVVGALLVGAGFRAIDHAAAISIAYALAAAAVGALSATSRARAWRTVVLSTLGYVVIEATLAFHGWAPARPWLRLVASGIVGSLLAGALIVVDRRLLWPLLERALSLQDEVSILVRSAAAGVLLVAWWSWNERPLLRELTWLLSIVVWASLLVSLRQVPRSRDRRDPIPVGRRLLALALVLGPVLLSNVAGTASSFRLSRPEPGWFSSRNPFGLSAELVARVRALPRRSIVLADPLGNAALSVYAPCWVVPMPEQIGALVAYVPEYRETEARRHPLFNADWLESGRAPCLTPFDPATTIDHASVLRKLVALRTNYVLVQRDYYDLLRPYFLLHPEDYAVTFDRPASRELVVEFRGASRS